MLRTTHSLSFSTPKVSPQLLVFHFSWAFHDTHLATRLHNAGPPKRPGGCISNSETPSHNLRSKPTLARPASQIKPPPRVRELLWRRESSTPLRVWPRQMLPSRPSSPHSLVPSLSVRRSSCQSLCLCSTFVTKACMCSQLTPLSAPTHRLLHSVGSFSSGSRSTGTVVYHWENTLSCAIARKPRSLASGFLRNTSQRVFHASGARHSPSNRFANQCVTSHTVSIRRQHLSHQAIGRALAWFFIIFLLLTGRGRLLSVFVVLGEQPDCLLCIFVLESSPEPLISITVFAMGPHLVRPLDSVLAGTPVDPELRHNHCTILPLGEAPLLAPNSLRAVRDFFLNIFLLKSPCTTRPPPSP